MELLMAKGLRRKRAATATPRVALARRSRLAGIGSMWEEVMAGLEGDMTDRDSKTDASRERLTIVRLWPTRDRCGRFEDDRGARRRGESRASASYGWYVPGLSWAHAS